MLNDLSWLGEIYSSVNFQFDPLSAYYLDGDFAETLMKGGAYRRYPGTAEEAKILGQQFCSSLFDNRFDELILRKSRDAWAGCFQGLVWDHTWIGMDRRARPLWILCATDTD